MVDGGEFGGLKCGGVVNAVDAVVSTGVGCVIWTLEKSTFFSVLMR